MPEPKLKLGFAGSLGAYTPGGKKRSFFQGIKDWFWTYRIHDIDHHTRSGYYLLKGIQRFKAKYPALADRLEVELWGLIDPQNKQQAKGFGVDDIVAITGYMPKRESAAKIAACDVLFLPLETGEDPLFIPGKIFDYLRTGKPVLILGHRSDCTDILTRAGVGILVDPYDADAIADQLAALIQDKPSLPEKYQVDWVYLEENFHFKNLAKQLDAVFQGLSGK